MNILVTGAAGTVGAATIKELLKTDENIKITAFELPTPKAKKNLNRFKDKISVKYGNISKIEDVDSATQNIDFAIHLAAIIPPLADEKPELAYKVNVLGTKNLIESLKKNSPNAGFIYSSSVSVYGDRIENPMIKTTDELIPSEGDEYAKTKIEAEKIVQNSGLKWTIFRLTAIFGVKNHKISKIMFHMPLETPMEFATPEDTGSAFAKAIFKFDELNGNIYNLSGGEKCRISYKKFLEISFNLFGLGKIRFPGIAFASCNFHCAYFADGDILENILHFRSDTVESYFEKVKKGIKPIVKYLTIPVSPLIKAILLGKSEPYKAIKKGRIQEITRFFGNFIKNDKFVKI